MSIAIGTHFYRRGFWLRSTPQGLAFAYVGRWLLVNRHYFVNV
jgi:hypothetical protein